MPEAPLFPIFVDLAGKRCVVIGGGDVAARKVRALLDCGAAVTVVSPEVGEELRPLLAGARVSHLARGYQPGDLAGALLAFAATDDSEVNAAVQHEAEERGLLLNAVDDPAHCSFYVPARIERGPISIAISTQGASPALARRLREVIEETVTPAYAHLADLLGRLRPEVTAALPTQQSRASAWSRLVRDEKVMQLLETGKLTEAEAEARRALGLPPDSQLTTHNSQSGRTSQISNLKSQITLGTRASKLALTQSGLVADALRALGYRVDLRTITTTGDRKAGPLEQAGIGVFVREIEEALLRGDIDLAVHSLKDMPTETRAGLAVAAIPERADPSDALLSRDGRRLADLPAGSRVATSSPRRRAQLRAVRPDFEYVPVRGNVDTRLRKLARGDFEAIILAVAGLSRLGLADHITERLSSEVCLPAPGQGALALQVRADDERMCAALRPLDHAPTHLAVTAERAFVARLGAGCSVPVSALAHVEGDRLAMDGNIAAPEGDTIYRGHSEGPAEQAAQLGVQLAENLLAQGAEEVLAACR